MSAQLHLQEALDALRSSHPRFAAVWRQIAATSMPEQPRAMEVLAEYALTTVELSRESDPELPAVFDQVEVLMSQGDAEVVEHLTTDYIEVLSNLWPAELGPLWEGRLGPRATAVARGWAAFWGAPH